MKNDSDMQITDNLAKCKEIVRKLQRRSQHAVYRFIVLHEKTARTIELSFTLGIMNARRAKQQSRSQII